MFELPSCAYLAILHADARVCSGCARAASGHTAAPPPSSVMNSRRLMSNMGLPRAMDDRQVGRTRYARSLGRSSPQRHGLHQVTISHPSGLTSGSGGPLARLSRFAMMEI